MGDGMLACFGFPQANEHAAEQAVRSALAIVDTVVSLRHPDGRAFQVRIGIETGIVVIGDMIGAGSAREHPIAGDTPNLAARLQALADPNDIFIGPQNHQLLGRRFEYESIGQRSLKGFPAAVPAWRVLREASAESRFAATGAGTRGTFVGRGKELSLLVDSWQRAERGQGRVLLISGESGMGKSRLIDMLSDRIGNQRCYRVTCQCSPYHTNSALYPVIRHLERAAKFASDDSDTVKLAKLESMLGAPHFSIDAPATSLIADLLSPPMDRYVALDLTPPQRKAATVAALVDLLTRLAGNAPVLLLLEDAHWIDPTTMELWTRLVDSITTIRLLALVTARSEFTSPWTQRAHVSSIELARLTSVQAIELVTAFAPRVLEPMVVEDILNKSDGVPLFVEELTKAVLESPTPERPVVPATLHDSLMARLDRLGPAKEIAQVAAVIGQQFSHALLLAVASYSEEELAAGMDRLVDSGLVYRRGAAAELTYTFKHALLRDVAYENLLRARRQVLHERVGRVLVDKFAYIAESEPELLAHHFFHAAVFDLALTYRARAGDRAVSRSSFVEAIAHFSTALTDAAHLAPGPDRMRRELDLLLKLVPALSAVYGYQSTAMADASQRANQLAMALGDETARFKSTWGIWINATHRRQLELARDRAEELVTLARNSGNDDHLLEGFHCLWSTAQFRGDVPASLEASLEGVGRYDRMRHSWMGPVFGGHDPGVCAFGVCAVALGLSGRHAEARVRAEQSLTLAEQLNHPSSLAHALVNASLLAQIADDAAAVEKHSQRLIALAEQYNLPPVRAHARFISGWACAIAGDLDAGLAIMEAEYPRAVALGPFFRYYAALLAEGRVKSGRVADALAVLQTALDTVTEAGVGFYISELYRLQGICWLRTGGADEEEGRRALRTAIDVAKQQQATLLELRAAVSLAREAAARGWPATELEPLRELCATLPPEFDHANLREAKAILSIVHA